MIQEIVKNWILEGGNESEIIKWLENNSPTEKILLKKYVKTGENKRTATEIINYLQTKTDKQLSLKKLGAECKLLFPKTKNKEGNYCYKIDFIL